MKTKKTKIMLIAESQNLRCVLKDYFEMMGYKVIDFADGESAIRKYITGSCNICLLDVDLPKKDGYAVIRELHSINFNLPVIFITEKSSKEERIKGFKAGCDDYVIKPFSTEELLLRVETVLRRCGGKEKQSIIKNDTIFNIGDSTFNYNELKLINGEQTRILTRKEAQLLILLYEHKNKLVPREILIKEIWGDKKAAAGRSLDVFLSKIRTYLKTEGADAPENLNPEGGRKNKYKLGAEPQVEVINVHGMGYLLKIRD